MITSALVGSGFFCSKTTTLQDLPCKHKWNRKHKLNLTFIVVQLFLSRFFRQKLLIPTIAVEGRGPFLYPLQFPLIYEHFFVVLCVR